MTVTVRVSDALALPEDEFLAVWETCCVPAAGDVVSIRGEPYDVEGRLWRSAEECLLKVSRRR